MKGIVIAAGMGTRMRPYATLRPKCLLEVAGRTILEHTVDLLRSSGCNEIIVITGHLAEMIEHPDIVRVHNADYEANNILHSLMCASDFLDGPAIVTYSDIWVEPGVYETLLAWPGDIVIAADRDWQAYYDGRMHHPVEEAENAIVDSHGAVVEVGKHIRPESVTVHSCAEFLGLLRFSASGASLFRQVFDRLDKAVDDEEPFQRAAHWRTAYLTDMLQELIDRGHRVDAAMVERGWAELDTADDYERLVGIAARQGLVTITDHEQG